jgi:hypothetical protein
MDAAAAVVSRSTTRKLAPRVAVSPLRRRPSASGHQAALAAPAGTSVGREVFAFVNAGAVGDASVGYSTWNFGLLSTVAYFGLTVNSDGSLVQSDTGWNVWHSSTASGLLNAAHANGVRVVISLVAHAQPALCSTLSPSSIQTTVTQTAAQLLGADGVNIDYEGANQTCTDGVSLRTKMDQLAQAFRARGLGYLSIDTYASSAEDSAGFFDIPTLAASVDSMFVMDYGLETSNGPCSTCMGATSPLGNDAQNAYPWNVTRSANDYQPWAAQTILGFPYYGVKSCVNGPNPPANAPVVSQYGADPYVTIKAYPSDPKIQSWSGVQRDALDPAGQEPWASFFSTYVSCWREEYWDDPTSLGHKYDLVNQDNFRGAGIFTLDYGGGAPELWNELASKFRVVPSWSSLGGSLGSGPGVASWASNRMDTFAADGNTGALLHKWSDRGQWSGYENLGGTLASGSNPAAVSWGPNRIDVFIRGIDNQLWHRWWNGSTWSGWEQQGGTLTSSPTVASWSANRLDVFIRGADLAIWHKWWNGAGWSGWQSLGGVGGSAPAATSWGPNRIDVFMRGTDNALWHLWWDGTGWFGWQWLGGALTSAPAASSWGTGRIDLVVLLANGSPNHLSWWSGWSPWSPLGGTGVGDPAVVDTSYGTIDAFVRGTDGALWYSPVPPQ